MKYAYRNAHLLDGTRDMLPRDGLAVLTDGETIVGIVPEEAIPEGFEPVDLGGKYLMPGLINLHVHLAGNGKPQKKRRDNEKPVRRLMGTGLSRAAAYHVVAGFARLEVMSGVTTIRTVGGLGDFDTRLRDEIAAGIQQSVAKRCFVMAKKAGAKDHITLTGGCAKNKGLKAAIETVLRVKVIDLPVDPQLMGALGAAEYARQKGLE